MTLTLGETWRPWHPSVRRGVLVEGDGPDATPRDVLVVLAPWLPSGVSRAREAAGNALELRDPCVLPLLDIRGHNRKIAFIYGSIDGVAVSRLVEQRSLGHRAAAELLATVADCVGRHPHPGPDPDDVLLCADASVRVANFARPFPDVTGPIPPGDGTPEAEQVYRLGALLAFVLGGPLPPTSTEDAHDAAVRRAQIRAMSRPGAVFSEAYGNWLRAMLAWDPIDRPPLSRVAEGLRELATNTAGPTLAETTEANFTEWLVSLVGFEEEDNTLPTDLEQLGEIIEPIPTHESGRRTLGEEQVLGDLTVEDDPTVDSELGVAPETPPSIIERGSIPVSVGPPAEVAAKRRPSLPKGFLQDDEDTAPSKTVPMRISENPPEEPAYPAWFSRIMALLALAAVMLGLWYFTL